MFASLWKTGSMLHALLGGTFTRVWAVTLGVVWVGLLRLGSRGSLVCLACPACSCSASVWSQTLAGALLRQNMLFPLRLDAGIWRRALRFHGSIPVCFFLKIASLDCFTPYHIKQLCKQTLLGKEDRIKKYRLSFLCEYYYK